MENNGKIAIILGATGETGKILLKLLLEDQRYTKLIVFGRRSVGFTNDKLQEFIIDLFELDKYQSQFIADEVFCCIGTTKAKTPNKDDYRKIDYGIPTISARLCSENKIDTYLVISALGANADSRVFYNRVKGEMEMEVLARNIPNTYILQPSLIAGPREEKRAMEYLGKLMFRLLNPLLFGRFKKYRSIESSSIANAMIWLANGSYKSGIIRSDQIQALGESR